MCLISSAVFGGCAPLVSGRSELTENKSSALVEPKSAESAAWRQPNAVSFVAERRKPSGIALRNTNDSPGGLRRSATIHPWVDSKVDGIGRQPTDHNPHKTLAQRATESVNRFVSVALRARRQELAESGGSRHRHFICRPLGCCAAFDQLKSCAMKNHRNTKLLAGQRWAAAEFICSEDALRF